MEHEKIDFVVHESAMARMERQLVRMHILCIAIFAAFVISNFAWIVYENQFVDETTSVSQDIDSGDGDATVIGIGDINGESKTNGNENQTDEKDGR